MQALVLASRCRCTALGCVGTAASRSAFASCVPWAWRLHSLACGGSLAKSAPCLLAALADLSSENGTQSCRFPLKLALRHPPQACAPLPNPLAEGTFHASVEAHTGGVPIIRSRAIRAERPDLHPDIHDASMPPIGLKPQDCLHSTMAPGAFDGEVSQLLVRARSEVSLATCIPGAGKTRSRACKKVRMGTYGEVASGRRHVLKVDPRRKFVWARSPSISLLVHLREPDPASP